MRSMLNAIFARYQRVSHPFSFFPRVTRELHIGSVSGTTPTSFVCDPEIAGCEVEYNHLKIRLWRNRERHFLERRESERAVELLHRGSLSIVVVTAVEDILVLRQDVFSALKHLGSIGSELYEFICGGEDTNRVIFSVSHKIAVAICPLRRAHDAHDFRRRVAETKRSFHEEYHWFSGECFALDAVIAHLAYCNTSIVYTCDHSR